MPAIPNKESLQIEKKKEKMIETGGLF